MNNPENLSKPANGSSSSLLFFICGANTALGRAIQVKADKIGLNTNLDWDKAEIVESTWPNYSMI